MSEQELKLLFHTLGYNFYPDWDTEEGGYRNYFAIGKNSQAYPVLCSLVNKGYMKKTVDSNELVYFCAASKGIELVKCEFMKKRQKAQIPFQNKSRSKRRYQAYLEYGDGFNSFLDFLYFLDSCDEGAEFIKLKYHI